MKKILFLIITFTIAVSSYGQNNCVNEVDTHPDVTPTQNHLDALPRDPGNSSTPDDRFINAWKWWCDHDPQSSNSIPLNNMGLTPPPLVHDCIVFAGFHQLLAYLKQ